MTDNIKVKQATERTAVSVKTDVIEGVHVPVYKTAYGADGELTLIDNDNPLPTDNTDLQKYNFARQEELLVNILLELKLLNRYMSFGQDIELTENDIEE